MTTTIALRSSTIDNRRQAAVRAVTSLIEETCFWSTQSLRHQHCYEHALEMLGLSVHDCETEDEMNAAIRYGIEQNRGNFIHDWYCEGAATTCTNCGTLVEPGYQFCPDCNQKFTTQVAVLTKPEWELRLTTRVLEIAINTSILSDELLTGAIFQSVRLIVVRNLLNQSEHDDWKGRIKAIQAHVIDAWPEDSRPDKTSWEWRYARECATFWVVAWPMLKKCFTLADIEKFSTKIIRAIAVSSRRWAEEGADPDVYCKIIKGLLESTGIDKERAIRELYPEDADPEQSNREPEPTVVFHAPEILARGKIARNDEGKPWLTTPLEEQEVDILVNQFGIDEDSIETLVAMMVDGGKENE